MRFILIILLFVSFNSFGQWKHYELTVDGDTLNRLDQQGRKQGVWVLRAAALRGEPGYEEEGKFLNDRKEGEWKLYNLMGDLIGIENYKWGLKDGPATYYSLHGGVRLEQSWKALNPDKQYDTLMVEDVDKLESYREVIVKNEGAALKHGTWKYYDPETGSVVKTETYVLGHLQGNAAQPTAAAPEKKAVAKPKEVLEFEKKNSGKKRVKYQDGSTN
jgi:antitoxin component YwqK of YwqJK toxin-antitoxin module